MSLFWCDKSVRGFIREQSIFIRLLCLYICVVFTARRICWTKFGIVVVCRFTCIGIEIVGHGAIHLSWFCRFFHAIHTYIKKKLVHVNHNLCKLMLRVCDCYWYSRTTGYFCSINRVVQISYISKKDQSLFTESTVAGNRRIWQGKFYIITPFPNLYYSTLVITILYICAV